MKLNSKLKTTLLVVAAAVVALLTSYLINSSQVNKITKEKEKEIQRLRDSISKSKEYLVDLEEIVREVEENQLNLEREYDSLLSVSQSRAKADSLQLEEIRKGRITFGKEKAEQPQEVLASIYGNRALDNLAFEVKKRETLETFSVYQFGIINTQDSIIINQEMIQEKLVIKAKKSWWSGTKIGVFIGAVLTALGIMAL